MTMALEVEVVGVEDLDQCIIRTRNSSFLKDQGAILQYIDLWALIDNPEFAFFLQKNLFN